MATLHIPTFDEIQRVSASRGQNSYAPHLWKGLVGWWPMQEGGGATAFDASGWRRHGTLNGTTGRSVNRIGRTGNFGGTAGDTITAAVTPSPTNQWTISVWAMTRLAATVQGVYRFRLGVTTNYCRLYVAATGRATSQMTLGGVARTITGGAGGVVANVLNHFVFRYNGSVLDAWLNGKMDGTPNTDGGDVDATINTLTIGEYFNNGSPIDGHILHFANFHRALLPSEIQQLYADPWAMGKIRRKVFAAATVSSTPLSVNSPAFLIDDEDVFVGTMVASYGTSPYFYEIISQIKQ